MSQGSACHSVECGEIQTLGMDYPMRHEGILVRLLNHLGQAGENSQKEVPQFYAREDELSKRPDGLFCLNDRTIIALTLRQAVLEDLHSSYFGIGNMKSLARHS